MSRQNFKAKPSLFQDVGRSKEDILSALSRRRQDANDLDWHSPRNLKACYFAGDEALEISQEAFSMFFGDNLLYANSLFPSLPDMSADVVEMALEMLNAPSVAGGVITSGGTESILLATRAALRRSVERGGIPGTPEIVLPANAHPAFDKSASLMDIRVIRTELRDHRAAPAVMAAAISENTVMLVGSAHAYPLGHIDPISEISALCEANDIWLHVDSCVGGFFLPFAEELGYAFPAFDFRVSGVTSMSADLHKYGYTARGASMVMFRDETLSRYHEFNFDDWPTGAFNTPTMTGSRPAGVVASAWAVMNYLGRDGYRDRVKKTLHAKDKMIQAVTSVPGIHVTGAPEGGLVGFHGDPDLDMLAVRHGMTARGWQTGIVLEPAGFQMILNYRSNQIVDEFVTDLSEIVSQVRQGRLSATGTDMSYGS